MSNNLAYDVLANLKRLPEYCYVANTIHARGPAGCANPPVLRLERGVPGYFPIYTKLSVADLNKGLGVTDAEMQAMLAGSMFGWHVPGANPAEYETKVQS